MLIICRDKCIQPRFSEPDLSKGESVCTDRCVAKFVKSNMIVSNYLRESGNGPDTLSSFRSAAARAGGGYVAN